MNKTVVVCAILGFTAFVSLVGCITVYNINYTQTSARLYHDAKDPLAMRCAWVGDSQVCAIAAARHQ